MTTAPPAVMALDLPKVFRQWWWIAVHKLTGRVLGAAGLRGSCGDLNRWILANSGAPLCEFEIIRVRLIRPYDWLKNLWNWEFPRTWFVFKYRGHQAAPDGAPVFDCYTQADDCFQQRHGESMRQWIAIGRVMEIKHVGGYQR